VAAAASAEDETVEPLCDVSIFTFKFLIHLAMTAATNSVWHQPAVEDSTTAATKATVSSAEVEGVKLRKQKFP